MATQRVDRQTFLTYLGRSELVDPQQLRELLPRLPDSNRGRLLARKLVEMGILTRFQAERILAGRTAGFHLGQYRILDQIGKGGMGRVYKAQHLTMGRIVALKVLAPDLMQSERAQELFLREVQAAGKLIHPNIVTAYDANNADDRFYLVLEYVDGPNLDQLVRAQGPLSVGLACEYIRQAAAGLQGAHLLGMVHRDIKPANILVQRRGLQEDQPGLVKISDFGLARLHHPTLSPDDPAYGTILIKDNTVMGTPDYLSPEQARNLHKVDIRSDIYSLGCTFYFLLTGQVPYPGGNALDKLIRHTMETPIALERFRDDLPREVIDICEKMLAKTPERRFQTPAEVAAALEPYAVSGPIPWAPPPSANSLSVDAPETPVNFDGSDGEMQVFVDSDDEMSALSPTLTNDGSPTPLMHPRLRERERWRWELWLLMLALVAAVGILVGGLVRRWFHL
jgi:serine/threonine-protein kinase